MGVSIFPYIDWTYEVFVPHQNIGHTNSKDNGKNPSSYKTFHRLLRREFYELCTAKCNATNVCKDIIANDQGDGQEEPDHSFKDIVHDKVRLNDNEVQSHMRPRELSELETVMTCL
jgi:hypothetical protein